MELLAFTLAVFLLSFLLGGSLLHLISKFFGVKDSTYTKSLLIIGISGVATLFVNIILGAVASETFSAVVAIGVAFFLFSFVYKKYYGTSWAKSLGIYLALNIVSLLLFVVVVVPIRLFVVSPFFMVGSEMSPAYEEGDYLLVNKLKKQFSRGDVVVFRDENQPKSFFVKRVVGLPSEKIDIRDGSIFINDQFLQKFSGDGQTNFNVSMTLGPDQYFVLSDNRNQADDSRHRAPVFVSDIEGEIVYRLSGFKGQ